MPSRRPITDARAYGKFGKHLRWKIIEAAYNYGWSAQEIADWLNRHPSRRFISRASVYRVLQRFDATGDVRTPRGGERRREGRLTREDWALLSDALDADPALYLDEMQALLKRNQRAKKARRASNWFDAQGNDDIAMMNGEVTQSTRACISYSDLLS